MLQALAQGGDLSAVEKVTGTHTAVHAEHLTLYFESDDRNIACPAFFATDEANQVVVEFERSWCSICLVLTNIAPGPVFQHHGLGQGLISNR